MWDPLRKKEVAPTPEETVRQWFIGQLAGAGVPMGLMMSEVSMKYGRKPYRADIMVYDREGKALAIVECKREEVPVSQEVAEQALRYHAVTGARWIFLTNGSGTFIFKRQGERFVPCGAMPTYNEMLCLQ